MTAPLTIHITDKHIAEGNPGDSTSCPIALAILEQANTTAVEVNNWVSTATNDYIHTQKSLRFLERFDAGQSVRPTTMRFYAAPL